MPADAATKLSRTFALTWMADTGKVAVLDTAVRDRQRWLLKRAGAEEEVPATSSVEILVETLHQSIDGFKLTDDRIWIRRVLVDTVLTAELIASALCPDEKVAGGIYELVRSSGRWREWNYAHRPLQCLRNAVLHPGLLRSEPYSVAPHLGSAVDSLRQQLEANGEFALANDLYGSPADLFSPQMADWGLTKLNDAGERSARMANLV